MHRPQLGLLKKLQEKLREKLRETPQETRPTPRRAAGVLALALVTAGLAGCNSDETFSITTEDETTGGTKTPSTSLPMTTRGPEPDMPPSDAPFVSCLDMLSCLFSNQDGNVPCQFINQDFNIEIDFVCVLGCVGVEGTDIGEILWQLDLGLCLADVCAQEPYTGPLDPGPEHQCNPEPSIGIDVSAQCLQCMILKMSQLANGQDLGVCMNELAKCDDDPNTLVRDPELDR